MATSVHVEPFMPNTMMKMKPHGSLTRKANNIDASLATVSHQADNIRNRSRRLEMSLEEVYEENEKLRAELQWTRDERDAALRTQADAENNLRSTRVLRDAEVSQLNVSQSDLRKAEQTIAELKRDNTAFHSENVEVRVNYDELRRERAEREMRLHKMTAERNEYRDMLDKMQDNYNDLQSKLTFAISEYSLRFPPEPVRIATKDGGTDSLRNYLQEVANDHPLSRSVIETVRPVDLDTIMRSFPTHIATRPLGNEPSTFTSKEAATGWGLSALDYSSDPFAPTPDKLNQDMLGTYAREDMQRSGMHGY